MITIVENENTIPTLFKTVEAYAKRKDITPSPALWDFFTKKDADGKDTFSMCHFWTNFEVRLWLLLLELGCERER